MSGNISISKDFSIKKSKLSKQNVDPTNISIIGHRGAGARSILKSAKDRMLYPENSLAGFREIMRAGADGIEFDLLLSYDKKLMVVHDNDLSINCLGIVHAKISQKKDHSDIGTRFLIKPGKFFVRDYECKQLQEEFDICLNYDTSAILEADKPLYTKMPEFSEVLEIVSIENLARKAKNQPRVKLNIELKGPDTGDIVEQTISKFNSTHPGNEIYSSDVCYMSFIQKELLAVLKHNPKAQIVFGVPTKMQYCSVDHEYNIEDANFNYEGLKAIEVLNNFVKSTPRREGHGLNGVDMSIWDVSDKSIEFFCTKLQLPIHLAIVPFSLEDLKLGHIEPVLNNYWKIIYEQFRAIIDSENITIFIKTDEPLRLREYMLNEKFNPDNDRGEILGLEVLQTESQSKLFAYQMHSASEKIQNIPLFRKASSARLVT